MRGNHKRKENAKLYVIRKEKMERKWGEKIGNAYEEIKAKGECSII